MENRLQRRPRSTSMKDRQNSKAQSDRTSSMESECSPDSRLIAQVQQQKDAAVCTLAVLGSTLEMEIKEKDKIRITLFIPEGKYEKITPCITVH